MGLTPEHSSLRERVVGICVVCCAIAVTAASPRAIGPLPPGIRTPVVAFELARTQQEVEQMFGAVGSPQRATWRTQMQLGVWLDFALLLAYGVFLAGAAYALLGQSAPRLARAGLALALFAAVCDEFENRELLAILARLGGAYAGALARLAWFTWLKWLALGAYFALLAAAWRRLGILARASAAIGSAGALAALVAIAARGVFAEVMAIAIALAITSLVVAMFATGPPARAPG